MAQEGIHVLVRVRPANEKERFANRFCVDVDDEKRAVLLANRAENKTAHFVYDQVTGRDGTQAGIFESVGKPMCESVLQGYNCCVFAYGQTGAGKTFTMMGDGADSEDPHSRGLIQRVFDHLFTRIAELQEGESKIDVTCTCSYLEIYNEQVTDLLSQGQGSGSPPIIRDDPKTRSIVIEGAVKTPVKSSADTLQALTLGQQNRKVAATNMNKESSRSHCVFTLYLQSSCVSDGVTSRRFSRFNLIDLAGSERQKQTQATGDRLKEANNINRSLSALGNVIMSLANNNGHVPYRDSKLTFMLKDSIGGNSKTSIIACVSPAESCYDETLSTLKFVRFAKLVKNVAQINTDTSAGDMDAMRRKIARLEHLLREARAGGGGCQQQPSEVHPLNEGDEDSGAAAQDLLERGEDGSAAEDFAASLSRQLRRALERESEARAAAAKELSDMKAQAEAQKSIHTALDKSVQTLKMQLKFKEATIAQLEKKPSLKLPSAGNNTQQDTVAPLKEEIKMLEAQLSGHTHPEVVRQTQLLQEARARQTQLEALVEDKGVHLLQAQVQEGKEEIDQLTGVLKTILSGKTELEERVQQLMCELDDSKETIDHLNVCIDEREFAANNAEQRAVASLSEVNTLTMAKSTLQSQLATQQQAHAALEDQFRAFKAEHAALASEYAAYKTEASTKLEFRDKQHEEAMALERERHAALEDQFRALQAEHAALASEYAAYKTEASTKLESRDKQHEEAMALERERHAAEMKDVRLQTKTALAKAEAAAAEVDKRHAEEKHELLQRLKALQAEAAAQKEASEALAAESSELALQKIEAVEAEVATVKAAAAAEVAAAAERVASAVAEASNSRTAAERERLELQQRIEHMEAAADAEAAEGFERTAQVAAARGEVNGLQAKVLDLQQQLEAATEREQAARKTAHTESEERLKMVVDELQRVEAASDASEKSQRKKVEELEQSLAAKTAAVDVLQGKQASQQQHVQSLEEKLKQAREQLNELEQSFEQQLAAAETSLQTEITEMRARENSALQLQKAAQDELAVAQQALSDEKRRCMESELVRKELEVKFKKQLEDFILAQSPKTPKATRDIPNTPGRTSGPKSTPRGTRDKTLDAADVGTLRLPGGALSTQHDEKENNRGVRESTGKRSGRRARARRQSSPGWDASAQEEGEEVSVTVSPSNSALALRT